MTLEEGTWGKMNVFNEVNKLVNHEFIQEQVVTIYEVIQDVVLVDLDWPEISELIAFRQAQNQNPLSAPAYGVTLPVLTCLAVGGKAAAAVPVASAWALLELAGHILDDLQDQDNEAALWADWPAAKSALISTTLLFAAQACLAELAVDTTAQSDIIRSLSQACMQGVRGQFIAPRTTSLELYFRHLAAKAGITIAAVAYAGARTHTDNAETLQLIFDFGLNLGLLMQLNDDLRDLSTNSVANDLKRGYYSLPVLQALTQTEHSYYARLSQLLAAAAPTEAIITEIVAILVDMGAFSLATSMARVYQKKALDCLEPFPAGNIIYLKDFLERFLKIESEQVEF